MRFRAISQKEIHWGPPHPPSKVCETPIAKLCKTLIDLKYDSVKVSLNGENLKSTIFLDTWVVRKTEVGNRTEVKLIEKNVRVESEKGLSDRFHDENHRNDEKQKEEM